MSSLQFEWSGKHRENSVEYKDILNAFFYVKICKYFKPRYLTFPPPFNKTIFEIKLLNNSLYCKKKFHQI